MKQKSVWLGGSELGRHRHVCAFFHNEEEKYRALLPFIQGGFEQGDRAFHIVDPQHRLEHLRRLQALGIDVNKAEQSGQLEVRRWQDAHLRDGCFDQNQMLTLIIQEVLERGKAQGYPLTRFIANMEWALEDCPGVTDIVEYETRLNYALKGYDDPVICTYDLSRFDASVVIDIMRTHPLVIIGNILQENPFFVPPDQMLCELQERVVKK
ncbi:MAG: MEDS domain-containing protein [Candidatus Nitrosoglobus sp.]